MLHPIHVYLTYLDKEVRSKGRVPLGYFALRKYRKYLSNTAKMINEAREEHANAG